MDKLKAKLIFVVWGERYVKEFTNVALCSYLAPGNLPFLAAETDLEILVMTTQESRSTFEDDSAFAAVREMCPVRYIYIDDLITVGMYGVTLTLAFARAIMESGEAQTETHFVFANSDFFLADGSYRSLFERMNAGEGCVMAPSLRAISENVLPVLEKEALRGGGVLSMAPRDMVQLTIDNLHPTVIGKTVTSELASCSTHNQIYWQVNATTILARYHLIFMLMIKPEVPLSPINSYCDYGFVPEMIPSGKFTIMSDSDEFFMLETQALAQESDMLRAGVRTERQIAQQLTEWTTKEHRAFAEVDVVFHTADLPINLGAARRELDSFMQRVKAQMGAAKDHAQHFYWALGFQAWLSKIDPMNEKPVPPEVTGISEVEHRKWSGFGLRLKGLANSIWGAYIGSLVKAQALASRRPIVPVWHHLWPDFRRLRELTKSLAANPDCRNLFVCSDNSLLATHYSKLPSFDVVYLSDLQNDEEPFVSAAKYDGLILHLYRADVKLARQIIDRSERDLLKHGASVSVFVEHLHGEMEPSDFSTEIAYYIVDILPSHWTQYSIKATFVGGRLKRILRLMERRILRYLLQPTLRRLPLLVISFFIWPITAFLTVVNNVRQANSSKLCPPYCSSFLLTIEKLDLPTNKIAYGARNGPVAHS